MLNPVLLRTFLGLIEYRSFQVAAQRLGLAQPTVSLHIRKLEEQLGVLLFERARNGCEPTPQALLLSPYAQSLLQLSEHALAAIHSKQLRVGASSNIGIYLLPSRLKQFLAENPTCELTLTIDSNPVIAAKLANFEIDVALMEWWDHRPGFGCMRWRQEPVVAIVPPDHVWAQRPSISVAELAGTELLGGEAGTGTGALLTQLFGTGESPTVSMRLGSTEAVKQAVKAGLGISLVMAGCVEAEVDAGSLRAIPVDSEILRKELFVIWRESGVSHLPPPALVDFLTQRHL